MYGYELRTSGYEPMSSVHTIVKRGSLKGGRGLYKRGQSRNSSVEVVVYCW